MVVVSLPDAQRGGSGWSHRLVGGRLVEGLADELGLPLLGLGGRGLGVLVGEDERHCVFYRRACPILYGYEGKADV